MLNIQTRQEGSASIVTIQGKVNFEVTAQLRDVIRDTVASAQPKLLVINLEGVSFIDIGFQICITLQIQQLYICDASVFPGNNDKTTTMPIIAFAMRTCDHIIGNFQRGVHKRV